MFELGRRYVGSTAILLWGTACAQGIMALATLLTARQLGASVYGSYAACFAASGLASVAFNLGLDTWLLRAGAREPASAPELLGSALLVKTFLGLPWVVGMALLMPQLNRASFPLSLMALSASAIWLEGLFAAGLSALKAALRNRLTALFLFTSRGMLLAAIVLLMWWGQRTAVPYALARVVAGLAGLLLVCGWPGFKIPRLHLAWLKRVGGEALPFALSALLTVVYMRADVTIVAISLDEQSTGLYSSASSLVNALFFIPATIYSVAVPALVRVLDGEGREGLAQMLLLTFSAFTLVGCALWGGIWLSAPRLLLFLLGEDFAASGPILAVLSPILLLKSLSFALAALLVAGGWQYHRTVAQAFSALTNAGLNILIVRRYGVLGVAWVYVLSEMVLLLGYAILGWRWWHVGRRVEEISWPEEGRRS